MKLTLGFAGDFCLGGSNANESAIREICRDTAALTRLADLTTANFESCIVEGETPTTTDVKVLESQCQSISSSGIDIFTLANNHMRDYGDESVLVTRRVLNEQGIRTVGAGANIGEANAPTIVETGGKSIAFLGATDATHYKAERKRPGVAPLNARKLRNTIVRLRDKVDLIVVSIHSDLEFTNFPAPWKVSMSRQLARAGADIVIHHHPHTLQGIELFDDALIAYSLGNLVFPLHDIAYMQNRDGHVDESVFLKVAVDFEADERKIVGYELIPTVIDKDNRTRIATGTRGQQIIDKMSEYGRYLASRSMLRKQYWRRCKKLARSFVYGSYYSYRRDGAVKTYSFVKSHFLSQVHRNWMRGLISFGWF